VRKQDKENIAGQPVVLEFEKMDLDKKTLRELFVLEIGHYNASKSIK